MVADDVVVRGIDSRLIGALVVHECEDIKTDCILWITTSPEVRQEGDDSVICVRGFELESDPDLYEPDDPTEISLDDDPCTVLCKLEHCLLQLDCGQQKIEVNFQGRHVRFQPSNRTGLLKTIERYSDLCDPTGRNSARQSGTFICY